MIAALIVFGGMMASVILFGSLYGTGPWEWLVVPIMLGTLGILLFVTYVGFNRGHASRHSETNARPFNWLSPPAFDPVKSLLSQLEFMDPASATPETREAIREKILQFGPDALRTILKLSRHEGDDYREDVYSLFDALTGDPIQFFIDHLDDEDREIRWSCQKWIRDKGKGDTRPVEPLIRIYATRGRAEGSCVSEALFGIGPSAEKLVVEMVLDDKLPADFRVAAAENFESDVIEDDQMVRLRQILESELTAPALKDAVRAMLETNENWRALMARKRESTGGQAEA